jgi:hypothetical protein
VSFSFAVSFPQESSHQDRLGTTIANSMDLWHAHFRPSWEHTAFSKVDRCWQLSGSRLVNPDFAGRSRWFGSASYEALRVTLVPSGLFLRVWDLLRNGIPQQRSHFFLDVNDEMRLAQIFGEAGVLATQLLNFFFHRIALRRQN